MIVASFTTNPVSVVVYFILGVIAVFLGFAAVTSWIPDQNGLTHKIAATTCAVLTLIVSYGLVWHVLNDGTDQRRAETRLVLKKQATPNSTLTPRTSTTSCRTSSSTSTRRPVKHASR